MIIVINPMFSNQQVNSDSNYVYLRELLPEMVKIRPDWIFFMFWPSGQDWKYYDDGFFQQYGEKVMRVPKKWQPGKYRAGCDYDVGFYYDFFARNPFDIIWNNCVEQTPVFYNIRTQSSETWKPLIINYHHFPVHKTLPGINENYVGVQGLQAVGATLADKNVFNSKWCQTMAGDVNALFLNEEKISQINKSAVLNYMGPISPEFPETKDYSKPVFLYNHRIAGYKNWDVTFNIFDKLWSAGLKFEVLVSTVDAQSVSRVAARPYVQAFNAFTREQYLQILPRANMNVSNSQHETFCISMVESMAAGHVPIGPNRCTFPELMEHGKSGFIYQNEEEEEKLLADLIKDAHLRQTVGLNAKFRAQKMFAARRYAEDSVKIFEEVFNTMAFPESSKAKELEEAVRGLPKAIEFMPAYRRVQSELGWMNQAFPIKYFVFACHKYGVKFKFQGKTVWCRNEN